MNLLIRADANAQMGTGHVMRCLALAQASHDAGGHATFVMATEVPALEARLRSERIGIVHLSARPGSADDAIQTANLAQRKGTSWLVIDGYHFDAEYQGIIKDSALRLLFVDDNGHADHYYADIILNQNIHAHEALYRNREPYTRLFLGTEYVLLRREFRESHQWRRKIPKVARKVLVTLGGGDSDNVTFKIIQALQKVGLDGLEVVVVVGGSNPHYQVLQAATRNSEVAIRLARNVSNMSELMAWADLTICSGGTTCWELAFMGMPFFVVIVSENQQGIAEGLAKVGAAINCGWFHDLTEERLLQDMLALVGNKKTREELSQKGQQLVDGHGAERALTKMISR